MEKIMFMIVLSMITLLTKKSYPLFATCRPKVVKELGESHATRYRYSQQSQEFKTHYIILWIFPFMQG